MVSKRANYSVNIYRMIGGTCTDVTSTTLISQEEVLTINATVGVDGEVHEAEVIVDNDPQKTVQSGDSITISLGWEGGSPTRIFTGEIYDCQQSWKNGEYILTLKAREFTFLLLTDKITSSYPVATNIQTIVRDLVVSYEHGIGTYPDICEWKIGTNNVDSSGKTRTVDFVGEPIIDCLNKMCDITQRDWFLDANKDLNFFERLGRSSGKTITEDDMASYKYKYPYDLLCNKVKFYGKDNKCYPINKDDLTESSALWSLPYFDWRTLSDSTQRKAGTKSILCTSNYPYQGYGNIAMVRDFPSTIDLTLKQSFKTLRWASRTVLPMPSTPSSLNNWDESLLYEVYLGDSDGRFVKYTNFNRPLMERNYSQNSQFLEFGIPLGPDHEIDGEWTKDDKAFPNVHSFTEITAYDPTGEAGLIKVGVSPYLNTDDNDTSYIAGTNGATSGDFTFVPIAGSATKVWDAFIFLKFRGAGAVHTDTDYGYIYLEVKLGASTWLATTIRVRSGSYQGMMIGIPQLITSQANFNNMKLHFWFSGYADQEVRVSYARAFFCGSDAAVAGNFEWNNISKILFRWSFWSEDQQSNTPDSFVDWLHFDNGKWYGEYEDALSQLAYGLKFKEVFDDTCYSDTSSLRRATEYVLKFKDPIDMIEDVLLEFEGQESLLPGDTIIVDVPEFVIPKTFRIDRMTHKITEDLDYQIDTILSIDPPTFPSQTKSVSERIRRLQSKYSRKPNTESPET